MPYHGQGPHQLELRFLLSIRVPTQEIVLPLWGSIANLLALLFPEPDRLSEFRILLVALYPFWENVGHVMYE